MFQLIFLIGAKQTISKRHLCAVASLKLRWCMLVPAKNVFCRHKQYTKIFILCMLEFCSVCKTNTSWKIPSVRWQVWIKHPMKGAEKVMNYGGQKQHTALITSSAFHRDTLREILNRNYLCNFGPLVREHFWLCLASKYLVFKAKGHTAFWGLDYTNASKNL